MNPFTTKRKTYAVGVRAREMPIPWPTDDTRSCGAIIEMPQSRRSRRRMFRRLNLCAIPGLAPICCDSNDPETVKCGYLKRLLRKLPATDEAELQAIRLFVRKFLKENIPAARKLGFEEWLASTTYSEARKQELRVAYFQLRGGRPTSRQASHIDAFVKTESYPLFKWCRLIHSRCDAFKVWSGPLFKAIEERVYELPEFIKHTSVPDRPALVRSLRRAGRRYYQTDFTAFESHFTPEVMDAIECELYRHCLPWLTDIDFLCSTLCGRNRMRTRTGLRAECEGRRMSGDMCTSLGNGFTNLMLAKYIAWKQGKDLHGFVEGDDGLFATEAILDAGAYEKLGWTIKIEEVSDPCRASFCGMVFADSGEIIRNPVEFLANFGWTSSFIGGGKALMDQLLRAKALSCVYETPQCPIVGALARRALSETRGVVPRWVDDGYHVRPRDEIPLPAFAPSDDTRQLFSELYGIDVASQKAIERKLLGGDFDVASLLPTEAVEPYLRYSASFLEVG